jgi:hypothetical protein
MIEAEGAMLKMIVAAVLFAAGSAWGQTSVVCDATGDLAIDSGNGVGPDFPGWLDIVRSEVSAEPNGLDIAFTMTVGAPIPDPPAWGSSDNGSKIIFWGWRMIGDLADLKPVPNGECLAANGHSVLGAYFLDLIWNREDSSLRARLLDGTICSDIEVPYSFSPDRTSLTLILSKSLLTNTALIANPDHFLYFATNVVWKTPKYGNLSVNHIDSAPEQGFAEYSATANDTNSCY